ncbi:MAG: DUF1016 family protein, partial [Bacilli bacterium]|nr:DUF1016 family protein [Bacilli bacterium]
NNEITKKVKSYSINRSDLTTYFNVGKLLSEAGKHYGDGIIKEYSKKLYLEDNVKYDISSLNKMKKYYLLIEKLATVSPILSYSHYVELLPICDINKIKYYIKIIEQQNLSVRQLREKIKFSEYERLGNEAKKKIINNEETSIREIIPNPIVIKNSKNREIISEKALQQMILEDIPYFLDSLGNGFTFIRNEYRIKIGSNYNYIDLLLFNIEYNCYVVVELKITELKKEYIGQIEVYMNYIDKNLRKVNQDKTIGVILVRKDNGFILEYSSDKRIMARTYEFV